MQSGGQIGPNPCVMSSKRPAVFLDRDGVINENPDYYVKSWDEFHFLPGVITALGMLASQPWAVVIISNQSAIGRGIISKADLDEIHVRMTALIEESGGRTRWDFRLPSYSGSALRLSEAKARFDLSSCRGIEFGPCNFIYDRR